MLMRLSFSHREQYVKERGSGLTTFKRHLNTHMDMKGLGRQIQAGWTSIGGHLCWHDRVG